MLNHNRAAYQHPQYQLRGRYEEDYIEPRNPERFKERPQTPQEIELTPEGFIDSISEDWMKIEVSKREKLLKDFMNKFLAYQVIEANS